MTQLATAYRILIAHVYELAGTSRATSESAARAHGRTAAQGHVLSVVSEDPLTVPAIARRLGVSRQAVQRIVHDLADAHQVALQPNHADARSPHVTLTGAGRDSLAAITHAGDVRRDRMLRDAGVSEAEMEQATDLLRRLVAALRAE